MSGADMCFTYAVLLPAIRAHPTPKHREEGPLVLVLQDVHVPLRACESPRSDRHSPLQATPSPASLFWGRMSSYCLIPTD